VAFTQSTLLTEVLVGVLELDLVFDNVMVSLSRLRIIGELIFADQDLL
jgi:hypothetical protein